MKHGASAAALLLALLSVSALAQDAAAPSVSPERETARTKVRTACAEDVQRFCANIERGKGALRACLDLHQKDVSAACSAARAERAAIRAAEKKM